MSNDAKKRAASERRLALLSRVAARHVLRDWLTEQGWQQLAGPDVYRWSIDQHAQPTRIVGTREEEETIMSTFLARYIAVAFAYNPPTPERAAKHTRVDEGHDLAFRFIQKIANDAAAGDDAPADMRQNPHQATGQALQGYAQLLSQQFEGLPEWSEPEQMEVVRNLELARMWFNLHIQRVLSHNHKRHPILSEFAEGCRHLREAALLANRLIALEGPVGVVVEDHIRASLYGPESPSNTYSSEPRSFEELAAEAKANGTGDALAAHLGVPMPTVDETLKEAAEHRAREAALHDNIDKAGRGDS